MTWLPQHQPGCNVLLLRNYPAVVVRVDCRVCPHSGRYALAALMARFGPAAGLPDVLAALSATCPRRYDRPLKKPCGAGFPDLAEPLRWCRDER